MSPAVVALRAGAVTEVERFVAHGGDGAFAGMAAVLELLPLAVFLTDEHGNVVYASPRARHALARGSGLRESHGRLRCEFSEDSSRLVKALRRTALRGSRGGRAVVTARRGDGGPRFELMLVPAAARRGVVIFACAPETSPGFGVTLARELYGLSERESEVASSLVQGRTLEETAAALGVRKETVRSHLKRIFDKTGTSRQAELARRLSIGLFALETEP